MTTLPRTLVALAVLVALAAPRLAAPRPAHADLCAACTEPDVPDLLLHAPATVRRAEGSTHHEQASGGA